MSAANRNTLHKTKLEDFRKWCKENGIETRAGVGEFQVLQVRTGRRTWLGIYDRLIAKEHYTVDRRMSGLVMKFINSKRSEK